MNEVHERDLYAIYNSSGRYKGILELQGVGDFQSQGQLYNRMEDLNRNVFSTVAGDKAVFKGQRKLFNLHFLYSWRDSKEQIFDTREKAIGGGLLWTVTLKDGWGIEFLFGMFRREIKSTGAYYYYYSFGRMLPEEEIQISWDTIYICPIWLRKNFLYPFVVSPYIGVGAAFFEGNMKYVFNNRVTGMSLANTSKKQFIPMIGSGIEFFPGRFLHPRFEVRYFHSPDMTLAGDTYKTKSLYYSLGLSTSW